ncbi:SitI3 family protein [Kitasatospora sp. NPDC056181]|uniref:SitI3 family protein n=1 Tax=Kitasatospora sp. NPDC056181 TaxID=3345737 RepID=UPI0035E1A827
MAISYSLDLVTPLTPSEVAQKLDEIARPQRLFGTPEAAGPLLGEGAITAYGTWVRVVPVKPVPWGDPQIGGRPFGATVAVAFRLDKTADVAGQQDDAVRLTLGLLAQVPGDAVLHLDYEEVWLVRQGGELSLSERSDLWPARRLTGLPLPYHRQNLEFAFPEDD